MDLVGDLVQGLCAYLNVADLQTTADFPIEMEALRQLLIEVSCKEICLLNLKHYHDWLVAPQ